MAANIVPTMFCYNYASANHFLNNYRPVTAGVRAQHSGTPSALLFCHLPPDFLDFF